MYFAIGLENREEDKQQFVRDIVSNRFVLEIRKPERDLLKSYVDFLDKGEPVGEIKTLVGLIVFEHFKDVERWKQRK
jgi:hypothetical protein